MGRDVQVAELDWARLASPKVITLDVASMSDDELRSEVIELRERNARLFAEVFLTTFGTFEDGTPSPPFVAEIFLTTFGTFEDGVPLS